MKKILIESGPLIALFDGNDDYHLASVAFTKNNEGKRSFTTFIK